GEDVIEVASLSSGLCFLEWEPTEWSVVGIGANRKALQERLGLGKIKHPYLKKSLAAFMPKLKPMVQGASISLTPDERPALSKPHYNYSDAQIKQLGASAARSLLKPAPAPVSVSTRGEPLDEYARAKVISLLLPHLEGEAFQKAVRQTVDFTGEQVCAF